MDNIQKAKLKLSRITTAINREEKTLEEVKAKIPEATSTLKEVQSSIEKENEKLEKVKEKVDKILPTLKENEDKMNQSNIDLKVIVDEIEDTKEKKEKVDNDIESARKIYQKEKIAHDDSMDFLVGEKKEVLAKLESDESVFKETNKEILQKNLELFTIKGKMKDENYELEQSKISKEKELKEIENQLDSVLNKIEKDKEEISELNNVKEDIKGEIAELEEEKIKAEEDLEVVEKKLKEMKRYRFALVKKGNEVNRLLAVAKEMYKDTNMPIPTDTDPIDVPSDED